MIQTAQPQSDNPFLAQGTYSPAAVEVMRAMRSVRQKNESAKSSPQQVLETLKSLGYVRSGASTLNENDEAKLFSHAVGRFLQQRNIPHPTCEDVLEIAGSLGYAKRGEDLSASGSGLPIDRRRMEMDTRLDLTDRRSSTELSPQEKLDLTDEEHQLLDELKSLRERTDRGFASSEELLSIVWDLGYRPVDDTGCTKHSLNADERCRLQLAFTTEVEMQLRVNADGEFLTCRRLLGIVEQIGFRRN